MIVVWRDQRSDGGDIYAQRVSGSGVRLWTPVSGIPVCTAVNQQLLPQIASDGLGGAILAWQDNRVDPLGDIYAQRLDASGAALWTPNGISIVSGPSENMESPLRFRMIPDGVGGAALTFSDNRRLIGPPDPGIPKVWGQRVSGAGAVLWGAGVPIAAGAASYENASLVADGLGGIIVAWSDNEGGGWDIAAEHVEPSGTTTWGRTVLCSAINDQVQPEAVSDGSGGAIVAWRDNRSDVNGDIYAQRVDAAGATQWAPDGNAIITGPSANSSNEFVLRMMLDNGGVTLAFADNRLVSNVPDPGQVKVWLQRVDLGGIPAWPGGIPVAAGPGTHTSHRILSDAEGGSIVVWRDGTIPGNTNIFAQRFDASGLPKWGPGVSVCNALGNQESPAAVADGLGGVLCAWKDARADFGDVYAQYVDFTGVPSSNARWECRAWSPDGVDVLVHPAVQESVRIAPDGAGGAIIVWQDNRGGGGDIYAQRVSSSGVRLWPADGRPICTAVGTQSQPRVVPDGVGGAIVVWQDGRVDPFGDLYAQRVDALGNTLWPTNGVPIVSGPAVNLEHTGSFRAVPDGVGGVITTFADTRRPDGVVIGTPHIWAQRVDGSGSPLWGGGIPVSLTYAEQQATVSDGAGGAIVVWGEGLMFAQRFSGDGTALWGGGVTLCDACIFPDVTSDGAGGAIAAWVDYRVDSGGDIYAQRLDADGVAHWGFMGAPIVTGPSRNAIVPLPYGVNYFIRMTSDGRGGAFLAFIDDRVSEGVYGTDPKLWAQGIAVGGAPAWANGKPVGVDHLDHVRQSIVGDGEGGCVVVWERLSAGSRWDVMAQRLNSLGTPLWLSAVAVSDQSGDQYAAAVTTDGRGNAIAAWVDEKSGTRDVRAERVCVPNRLISDVQTEPNPKAPAFLSHPVPNPTGDAMSWTVTVRSPGRVRAFLVDVQGRLVATLLDRHLESGTYSYSWSARGAEHLSAGVYFLSLKSADVTDARKVVILR
jgi:hypothetical protein